MQYSLAVPRNRQSLVAVGLVLGLVLSALDQTIVTTAMPTIAKQLGGLSLYSWVFAAYMLLETSATPLFGKLADLFGRRRVYLAGMLFFLVGSSLCGLSSSMIQLVVFRALQGLGAAALMPLSFTIIADVFPPSKRGRMQGIFGAVLTVASLAGPVLGGLVTEKLGWHYAFFMNIPVGLAAVVLVWRGLSERVAKEKPSIDFAGAFVFLAAMIALLLTTVWGGKSFAWISPEIICLLAVGVGLLVLFVRIERRAKDPMLPLSLFRDPSFALTCLVVMLFGLGMFGSISYVPLFAQSVLGLSPSSSGSIMIFMMLGMGGASIAAGFLMTKVSFRSLALVGLGLLVSSFLLLSRIGTRMSTIGLVISMVLSGLGQGILGPTLVTAAQEFSEKRHRGVATSTNSFFRSIGGTFGVSILGAVLNASIRTRGEGTSAFSDSLGRVFLVAAAFAAIGLVFAFFLRPQRLKAGDSRGFPINPA